MQTDWIIIWDFRNAFPWCLLLGPIGVLFGVFFFFLSRSRFFVRWPERVISKGLQRAIATSISLSAVIVFSIATIIEIDNYMSARNDLAGGRVPTVEGVAVIHSATDEIPADHLQIANRHFENSSWNGISLFSATCAACGIIRDGMNLRISHIDGEILRIERRELPPTDTPH